LSKRISGVYSWIRPSVSPNRTSTFSSPQHTTETRLVRIAITDTNKPQEKTFPSSIPFYTSVNSKDTSLRDHLLVSSINTILPIIGDRLPIVQTYSFRDLQQSFNCINSLKLHKHAIYTIISSVAGTCTGIGQHGTSSSKSS